MIWQSRKRTAMQKIALLLKRFMSFEFWLTAKLLVPVFSYIISRFKVSLYNLFFVTENLLLTTESLYERIIFYFFDLRTFLFNKSRKKLLYFLIESRRVSN